MAYLRRIPRSPYWIAGFDLPDGRRTQRSTKLTDRKKAMRLAEEWEGAARNRIAENQARRVLSNINEIIHGSSLESPSVNAYSETWLARKRGETVPVTLAAYRAAMTDFIAFLGPKAADPLHYLVPAKIAQWRDAMAARASARTANNKLKVLRTMLQSAWRDSIIPENVAAKVSTLKTAQSVRRPFTLPELKRVLTVADSEWKGMILAGIYTGQRLRDIALIQWTHLDLPRQELTLTTSKTGRRQIIPLAAPLQNYLADLPASDDPKAFVFPRLAALVEKDGDVARLSQEFNEILGTAGLVAVRTQAEKTHGKGIGRRAPRQRSELSFHCLRHTATSLLKMAGVSEAVARDLIGHDSATVSQNYTHTDEASKRFAIEKLPDVTS